MKKFVNNTAGKRASFRRSVRSGIGTQSDGGMFIVGTPRIHPIQDIPLFVHESIESPTDVVHHVDVLRQLEDGDSVSMYVSGVGGCVSSVDLLIHEMQSAQARGVHIHCICTGLIASAFSFIPLYADSFELSEGFHALLHAGSANMGGTIPEFKASSAFTVRYMEERMRSIYKHFLSDKELDDMLEGKDLWLGPQEWIDRFKKRNEAIEAESAQQESEEAQPTQNIPAPYTKRKKSTVVQEEDTGNGKQT